MSSTNERISKITGRSYVDKMLEIIGWGLFFIWTGASLMIKLPVSVVVIGIALITIGIQITRKYYGLNLEGFWIIVSLLLLAGGIFQLYSREIPLIPILLMVAGVVLLGSVLLGKHKMQE
jgi:hypothetical protein